MRLLVCLWLFPISFVATVSQGDPWSSTREPPCCVWVGSQWFPSTQPPPCAAPRYGAASAQPDCRSGANSSIHFKCLLLSPVSSCCSRQMQGVVGAALNRQRELRVRCTASASRSSAEAASSVLSTSPESWIARVGRANSSTRQCGVRAWCACVRVGVCVCACVSCVRTCVDACSACACV